ncbi:acyl-CoA-binding protein [Mucilaginibacter ginsenosidivorax]|uniref:Acyl-CoA-binding protein n=1 Tax=Mucilaginibacter ginsenosidivorax TaxID=862126 RepID=A0A5B8W986_9SPHI|nr:acyl-CoA-binding protein [Mucilaginibacter ginsenosidivorax]QEC79525.1 acyl-CoA-binding protein [Mucilaginibacter ginsenosidivorax]
MTDLKNTFEKAVAESKQLPSKPDNETLLSLYSLYKQATAGDIDTQNTPAMFDFVAKAKYDAWLKLQGMAADVAMQLYINLVASLKGG